MKMSKGDKKLRKGRGGRKESRLEYAKRQQARAEEEREEEQQEEEERKVKDENF